MTINTEPPLQSPEKEDQEVPLPLTGEEVAKIVEEVYPQIPILVGCHLVDSNVVLTIAGMKGTTEFLVLIDDEIEAPGVIKGVEELDELLRCQLTKVRTNGKVRNLASNPKQKYISVQVSSLLGFERISRITRLPNVTEFNRTNGFDGLSKWLVATSDGLESAVKSGLLPSNLEVAHVAIGLHLGYPDIAVIGACKWWAEGKSGELQDSNIPGTGRYKESQPNFLFLPENANDPSIVGYINKAGEILTGFYDSPWHQKISQDSDFLRTRESQ